MNIRKLYRKSNTVKIEKLTIIQLREKASTLCRLLSNLFRRSELDIKKSSYKDNFIPGFFNNSIHIQYKDLNLNFTLSVTGKIKRFLHENSSKLTN